MATRAQAVDDEIADELEQAGLSVNLEDEDLEVVIEEDEDETPPPEDEDETPPPEDEEETPPPMPEDEDEAETEAAAAPDPLDPDLADDEEYNAFAPKIQKRIQREIRIRHQAEQAANMAVEKVREAEQAAVILRGNNNELQRQYAEVLSYGFESKLELKTRELKDARAAGEFETEQKVQGEIDELRFKHSQVKDMQRNIPAADATPAPAPAARPAEQPPNPLVGKWVRNNASWFNNPKFDAHREFVLKLDKKIAAEGYNKNTELYYTELDRRIDKAFPTLRRKPTMKEAPKKGGPVSGVTNSSPAKKPGKVVLKQSDLASMRQFGLDPQNKTHLRQYAAELKNFKE